MLLETQSLDAVATDRNSQRRRTGDRLDGPAVRLHHRGHEEQPAQIPADGGHPAQGLFDRRLSDGRESRGQRAFLGRAAGAGSLSSRQPHRVAQPRQDRAIGSISCCRRSRLSGGHARLRRTRKHLDQRRDPASLLQSVRRGTRPLDRGLRERGVGRGPLRRQPARRLLRREHVSSRARRVEGRARASLCAVAGRRFPPPRHPVPDRAPGEPGRGRGPARSVPALLAEAMAGDGDFGAWPPEAAMPGARALELALASGTEVAKRVCDMAGRPAVR